jgi:predicted ArsR family transcriptional regulator
MATLRRAGNTREAILEILRHHDARSVDELANELDLAGATVRRHLDVLLRDGYISVSQVRGRTGRPRYAFSLTEAGADFFGHHYVRITRRLLHEIAALTPEDTAGLDGSGLAELVFRKLAARLAGEYAPRVEGATLPERSREVARLLDDEGFDFDVVEEAGELRLLGRGCPCRRLRQAGGGALGVGEVGSDACDHDRELFESLIGGRVELYEGEELPAEFVCAYVVREA